MTALSSAELPLASKKIDILGEQLHYVEAGQGKPILFLHGIPTSSYLWRNVMPKLASLGRCIAVDLIGMGQSSKPDITYSVFDHIRFIEAFIDELQLTDITLVMHAWGSVIGFDIAMRREQQIRGLAFLEAQIRLADKWEMLSLPLQELSSLRQTIDNDPHFAYQNPTFYVDKILPASVMRRLSDEEIANYRKPFLDDGSAQPIWQYLRELPMGEGNSEVGDLINRYSKQLCQSTLPKLMFYAVPGFTTTIDTVSWAKQNLSQLKQVAIEDALHYPQESQPELVADEIAAWLKEQQA